MINHLKVSWVRAPVAIDDGQSVTVDITDNDFNPDGGDVKIDGLLITQSEVLLLTMMLSTHTSDLFFVNILFMGSLMVEQVQFQMGWVCFCG